MSYFRILVTSVATPIFVMLGAGLLAAIISPTLWSLLNGEYALEKVFQKTGLLMLTLLAFHTVRTTVFAPRSDSTKTNNCMLFTRVASGWLIGVLSLTIPICVLILLKVRIADIDALASIANILRNMASALGVGLIVGLIEEYIFRGWLLGWLQSKLSLLQWIGQAIAIAISAFYFAMLHFLKPTIEANHQNDTLAAGIDVLLRSLKHLFQHNHWDTLSRYFLPACYSA
jgi:membrane protease YdiL (CAAX protease family)